MAWRFEGRLLVVVHCARNPSNLEWQALLTDEAARMHLENERKLIISYGGGPDGDQRALLARQLGAKPAPTAIMTKSALVRAIASALLFFNRNMKVFGLDECQRSYDFLELSGAERDAAERVRKELEAEIGSGSTLIRQGSKGSGHQVEDQNTDAGSGRSVAGSSPQKGHENAGDRAERG